MVFTPPDYFRELRKEEIFPDPARPLEVDLGCGDGSFLVEMARHYPERDFLGVDRMAGRVEKTERRIHESGLANVKVMRLESSYTVGWLLPAAGISRLHLLCPDPWPKKRHHKHRLVNDREFLAGLERIIVSGGEFLLKTDHEEYFTDAAASLGGCTGFERIRWDADEFFHPQTGFESQWVAFGKTIHRGRWRRK